MKKSLLRVCISTLALCSLIMNSSFTVHTSTDLSEASKKLSAFSAPQYKELILQFDVVNEKYIADMRACVEVGGVFFKGYCPEQRTFMYLVDRDVQPDNAFLDKLLIKGFTYTIKEGSTIEQVKIACGMDTDPNDNSNETE